MNDDDQNKNQNQDSEIIASEEADPENSDELGRDGSTPDPEEIEGETVLDAAHKMNLHKDSDEEHQGETGVGEELAKQQQDHNKNE